ncbi:MAG: phenylalanine--tRNA ligase subunit beta [Clostridiales bacterium]|nr:phenylalanine--tRNA ligase subunit beta [Clostridiales bacterium]
MKLSRKWLNDFTHISATDKEYAEKMTMSGSKVETIECPGREITNVVVGKVLDIVRHENSDHLFICKVDVSRDEPITVVTGAQNVSKGDIVPVALHGATLPGGIKITKGNIRGVKSEGMLCSLSELNLTVNDYPYAASDGIFIIRENCVIGEDIRPVLGLDDSIVDFEITNNRADCLCMRGLARESAAVFRVSLNLPDPKVKGSGGSITDYLDINIENAQLCPRYTARFVKNIKVGPSPSWMRERLRSCGVRPINNIVDITNYVMLEYGQPMHAFDYACVSGKRIIVRNAFEGEVMATLDGTPRALTPDMLVIADASKAIGLAGVMGGENSEITENTQTIVFESANFNGVSIRKTAIALGMRTDASSRFEKGLDPLGTLPAVERACELVELLGAGEVVDGVLDVIASDSAPVTVKLEPEKINRLLGTDIPESFMKDCLTNLGFSIEENMITVPTWRSDVSHYSDIAEEVARFYGYDEIESTPLRGATVQGGLSERQQFERSAGALCRGMGFSEILTYSFIGHSLLDKLNMPPDHKLRNAGLILNPLGEDRSIMRTTLLPTMMETLAGNNSYRNEDVRLYEISKIFLPQDGKPLPDEKTILALGAYGLDMDFYAFKGCIEAVLDSLRVIDPTFRAESGQFAYHPGRCAKLYVEDDCLGIFGQIHPQTAENFGIDHPVYAAELDFDHIFRYRAKETLYTPLPRYPAVLRDIAVTCDINITVASLSACIKEAGGSLLQQVSFFDVYTGPPVPVGKKSVAFSLAFRSSSQSLSDKDIAPLMTNILDCLKEKLNAQLR